MITLPRSLCIDLEEALKREWLVGNGIGGYASSTPVGINTRRYHGLLVAALKPPVDRTVLLSSIEEELQVGDRTFYMGGNEYPDGKIHGRVCAHRGVQAGEWDAHQSFPIGWGTL